ncbi:peptide chain release factor-like protein [Candidatus Vidania fulgoroideorum]
MKEIAKKIKKINFFLKNNKKNLFAIIEKKILKIKMNEKKNIEKIKKMKNEKIYIEIRAGIGGDESCIFVKDIFDMYKKYLENKKIFYEIFFIKKIKIGIKRIIIRIDGLELFNKFFFENGVHRIQRIPKTDSKRRIHTSTCIVEVYKEHDSEEIKFNRKELKIETYKSSGAGGQSVNKTNSAVRIVHLPSGIKVECQKERSQIENKKFALKLLISKIKKEEIKIEMEKKISDRRKKTFLFSSRSNKIRTYNFIRNIITDHFLKKNFSKINDIFKNGRLELIFSKNKLIKKF